jgi:hypothetical protein
VDLTKQRTYRSDQMVQMFGLFDPETGDRLLETSDFVKGMRFMASLAPDIARRVRETHAWVDPDMAKALEWPRSSHAIIAFAQTRASTTFGGDPS